MAASVAQSAPVAPTARPEAKDTHPVVIDTKNIVPAPTTTTSGSQTVQRDSKPMDYPTSPMTAAAIDLEVYLHQTLSLCNKLAKTDLSDPALTDPEPQPAVMGLGSEVAAAKMLNYCIRMLHADGWHPPTIIRAMVLRESGLDAGMRTTMYKALRERREEIKVSDMKRGGTVGHDLESGEARTGKEGTGGSRRTTRKVVMPRKSRKSRSVTENGPAVSDRAVSMARAHDMGADSRTLMSDGDRIAHSSRHEGQSFGPFMSLI